MASSLYSIPGAREPEPAADAAGSPPPVAARTVAEVLAQTQAGAVIDELDRDLIGLAREEGQGRQMHYRISSYATDKPEGERY